LLSVNDNNFEIDLQINGSIQKVPYNKRIKH